MAIITQGEKIWQDQCTTVMGEGLPGQSPKTSAATYKPEFVWNRIHNGFRGMPPWKEVYQPEEVLALGASVLSD